MIKDRKYCCCIVLYNPDIQRINENIKAIKCQVEKVFLINNGSDNIKDIIYLIADYDNVEMIDLKTNKGIATALNTGCKIANTQGFSWILTLDQDSVCKEKLISHYVEHIRNDDVGQMTCIIEDRNRENNLEHAILENTYVDWCITSGSFINLSAWERIGGFDDNMFIDGVDRDFGLILKEHGYKTLKIGYVGLLHEVGKISSCINLFGTTHPIYNHSSIRKYYICRNNIYLARKHKELSIVKELLKTIARIVLVFFFEKDRIEKLKKSIVGIRDGFLLEIRKKC